MDASLRTFSKSILNPAPDSMLDATGVLRRTCACGNHAQGGQCGACRGRNGGILQRAAIGSQSTSQAPPIVNEVLGSPGQPLDAATRDFFEPRFAQDFSRVRVHADGESARAADAVSAQAYTVGSHIAFAAGKYAPSTTAGKRLLAHELTHVVQQRAAAQSSLNRQLRVGAADDPHERQADSVAEAVLSSGSISQLALVPDAGAGTIRRNVTPPWTVDDLKQMLVKCDGGLGIWAKAKKANDDKEPSITPGAGGFVNDNTGAITLDQTLDKCNAVQQLIQELSNLARIGDLRKANASAIAGDLSRSEYIVTKEKIEYESGVVNDLIAFDACKDKWPCPTARKEWARKAKDFKDYFDKFLGAEHKEGYGKWWDKTSKAAYEKKHPTK